MPDDEKVEVSGTPWDEDGLEEDNTGAFTGYVTPDTEEEGGEKSLEELASELEGGEEEEGAEADETGAEEEPIDDFEEEAGATDTWAQQMADSLRSDPEGTLKALARYYDVDLGGSGKQAAEPTEEPSADVPTFKEGEEFYDYIGRLQKSLTDNTLAKVEEAVQRQFDKLKESSIEARRAQASGTEQAKEVLAYLEKYHPDWSNYEAEMQTLVERDIGLTRYPSELYRRAKILHNRKGRVRAERESRGSVQTGERTTRPAKTTAKNARNVMEAFQQLKHEKKI